MYLCFLPPLRIRRGGDLFNYFLPLPFGGEEKNKGGENNSLRWNRSGGGSGGSPLGETGS